MGTEVSDFCVCSRVECGYVCLCLHGVVVFWCKVNMGLWGLMVLIPV